MKTKAVWLVLTYMHVLINSGQTSSSSLIMSKFLAVAGVDFKLTKQTITYIVCFRLELKTY